MTVTPHEYVCLYWLFDLGVQKLWIVFEKTNIIDFNKNDDKKLPTFYVIIMGKYFCK